jgi:hypothetical protein
MLLKSNAFRFILSFCLILCASFLVFADTIRLKDGSVIKGRIVGFRDGQFVVLIGDGTRQRQMTFFSDEIEAIDFESNSIAGNSVRTSNQPPPSSSQANTVAPRPNPTPASTNTAANPAAGNNNAENDVRILVGQPNNTQTASPRPNQQPVNSNQTNASLRTSNPSSPPMNSPVNTNSTRPKPIQLNLKVLADNTANGWTNAGWVVKKGQKIRIIGSGRISLGKGNYSTPAGISSLADKDKLMQKEPTGGLLAVVGDDNNDFVFIGSQREFTATRDGALFLGINEGLLDDNSGTYDVVVEIDPGISN